MDTGSADPHLCSIDWLTGKSRLGLQSRGMVPRPLSTQTQNRDGLESRSVLAAHLPVARNMSQYRTCQAWVVMELDMGRRPRTREEV